MAGHRIFTTPFASVYPMYVQKVERKGRSRQELDRVIGWLTGYSEIELHQQIEQRNDFAAFFDRAPALHPNRSLIKGVICGVRVEAVDDPLMQQIRQLDKLVDELAKGKAILTAGDLWGGALGLSGTIYSAVEDLDDYYARVKDNVSIAWLLQQMPCGSREFGVEDCNGYHLAQG